MSDHPRPGGSAAQTPRQPATRRGEARRFAILLLAFGLSLLLAAGPALVAAEARRMSKNNEPKKRGETRRVTLDFKNEDARVILASMQKQCGVKNLILDPEVKVEGTFYFRDVSCDLAFEVVLASLGLEAVFHGESAVTVSAAKGGR